MSTEVIALLNQNSSDDEGADSEPQISTPSAVDSVGHTLPLPGIAATTGAPLPYRILVKPDAQKVFDCPINGCGEVFKNKSDQREHFRFDHGDAAPYVCDECGIKYHHLRVFNRHVRRQHRQPCEVVQHVLPSGKTESHFLCRVAGCGSTYLKMQRLERHEQKDHGDGNGPHECDECGVRYYNSRAFNIHIRGQHRQLYEVVQHVYPNGNTGRRYLCTVAGCGLTYSKMVDMERHVKKEHGDGSGLHECDDCGIKYYDLRVLRQHFRGQHRQPHESVQYVYPSGNPGRRFLCRVAGCGVTDLQISRLEYHESKDHADGSGSYKCIGCHLKYTSARAATKHHQVAYQDTGLETK